jgi:peptidoglycan/xylan/chitin deacetylase (PgdA/CDA1 family)/PKD repeat protein
LITRLEEISRSFIRKSRLGCDVISKPGGERERTMKRILRGLAVAIILWVVILTATYTPNSIGFSQKMGVSNSSTFSFPENGAISIAFDDGIQTQYDYAYPLLKARGMVGTFYVVTDGLREVTGSNLSLTVAELKEMQGYGCEIGSHSKTHPDFALISDSQISYECSISKQVLQSYGFTVNNFAYPYGETNAHVDSIVSQYYRSGRSAYNGPYVMQLGTSQFRLTAAAGEPGGLSQVQNLIDQVYATNGWAIIFFHNIVPNPNPSDLYSISVQSFTAFLDYLTLNGVKTVTVNQALDASAPFIVDSYSITHLNDGTLLTAAYPSSTNARSAGGQAFTGVAGTLLSVQFALGRVGNPSGNLVAVLYAMEGTFGTNAVPTGPALAISNTVAMSSIGGMAFYTFTFPQPSYTLGASQYCIAVQVASGTGFSGSNCIVVGYDSISPTHPGNYFIYANNGWTGYYQLDACFSVTRAPAYVDITSLVPSAVQAVPGTIIDINVTARNEGAMTETFNITTYYNNNEIGTQTVTDLASGANRTLTFGWNTSAVPFGDYTISARYTIDKADNTYVDGTVTIFGPPIASFTCYPLNPYINQPVLFNASSSKPNGGTITNYTWNFDDGNITSTSNAITSHTYALARNYNVALTVTNTEGLKGSASELVTAGVAVADIFSVASNSTVSDLSFNSTSLKLSFTVAGPSGTTGLTNVTIAKTFVANVTNLKVFLDGNPLQYTTTETGDSWVVSFTYTHSTHYVMLALNPSRLALAGDLNNDGKVSLQDLVLLSNAYGSKPGDANWNPNADIDNDGKVGLADLTLLTINYGQHYP